MTPDDAEVPVLIAGGGLVGLSTAMFLAVQGVPSLVVEPLVGGSLLPRAAHFHLRTLELFRLAGIAEEVTAESGRDFLPEGAIVAMDSLAGRKVADIIPSLNQGVDEVSPCRRLFITQPRLEPILRRRAETAGAQMLSGHQVVGVAQDAASVTVTVAPSDAGLASGAGSVRREIRARYLVGADGAHSTVRSDLGIGFGGRGVFSNSITIYFTADLAPQIGGQPLSVIYVNHPLFGGFFRLDRACQSGFLVVNTVHDHPDGDAAADTSPERLTQLVRAGAGVDDLAVRIDGVARWRATAEAAERFAEGRVFLAGDAAHLMPPNGGFGGNTGIHDAHNLAWKLAAVLRGAAGPALLDSYDAERRPVARFTVEQAYSRYVTRTAPQRGTDDIDPVAPDFDIELGYLYHSSAVIDGPDRSNRGPDGGPVHADPRTSDGQPGSRAPHLWLERDGQTISTIDLARGPAFVLLATSEGGPWLDSLAAVAQTFPELAVDGWRVGGVGADLVDPAGAFVARYGLDPGGASLIRPDGFVAWRSPGPVADPLTTLRAVFAKILSRPADGNPGVRG